MVISDNYNLFNKVLPSNMAFSHIIFNILKYLCITHRHLLIAPQRCIDTQFVASICILYCDTPMHYNIVPSLLPCSVSSVNPHKKL